MTREKLVEIMRNSSEYEFDEDVAADRILAALEEERKGEVVLGDGELEEIGGYSVDTEVPAFNNKQVDFSTVVGKKGQLIFREDK